MAKFSINDPNQSCQVYINKENNWSPVIKLGQIKQLYPDEKITKLRLVSGGTNELRLNNCFSNVDFNNINKVNFSEKLSTLMMSGALYSYQSFIEMFYGATNLYPVKVFGDNANNNITNSELRNYIKSGAIGENVILNMFNNNFLYKDAKEEQPKEINIYNSNDLEIIFCNVSRGNLFNTIDSYTNNDPNYSLFGVLLSRWNKYVTDKHNKIYNDFWTQLNKKDPNVAPESQFTKLFNTYNNYNISQTSISLYRQLVQVYKNLKPYIVGENNLKTIYGEFKDKYSECLSIVSIVNDNIRDKFNEILLGKKDNTTNIKTKLLNIGNTSVFTCSDIVKAENVQFVNATDFINLNNKVLQKLTNAIEFINVFSDTEIDDKKITFENIYDNCKKRLSPYNDEKIQFSSIAEAQRIFTYLNKTETNTNIICNSNFKDYFKDGYNFENEFDNIYGKLYLKAEITAFSTLNPQSKLENEIRLLNLLSYESNEQYFNEIKTLISKNEYRIMSNTEVENLLNIILPEIFTATFNNLFGNFYGTKNDRDILNKYNNDNNDKYNYDKLNQDTFYDYIMGIIESMRSWEICDKSNPSIENALQYFNIENDIILTRFNNEIITIKANTYTNILINNISSEIITLIKKFENYTASNFKSILNNYCTIEANIYKNNYIKGGNKNELFANYGKYCNIFTKRLIYKIFKYTDPTSDDFSLETVNYWDDTEINNVVKDALKDLNEIAYNDLLTTYSWSSENDEIGSNLKIMDMQEQLNAINNYLFIWDCYGTNNNESVSKEIVFDYTLTPIRTLNIVIKTNNLISRQQNLTLAINKEINNKLNEENKEANIKEEETAIDNAIKKANDVYDTNVEFKTWLKEYNTAMSLVNSSYWMKTYEPDKLKTIKSDLENNIKTKINNYFNNCNYTQMYLKIKDTNYTDIVSLDNDKDDLDAYYVEITKAQDDCYACATFVNDNLTNWPKATIDYIYTTKRQTIIND